MQNRNKYSNYGMYAAGMLILTTFDTLSGYFFGSLGRLALLESIMHIMLIALLFMKTRNFVLAAPYAFLAVTSAFHGYGYLTFAFDFVLYFFTFLMCLLLLTDILPDKAHNIVSKLWFVPASLWFLYYLVTLIISVASNPAGVDVTLLVFSAFLYLLYAGAHLLVGLWLKKPYKN